MCYRNYTVKKKKKSEIPITLASGLNIREKKSIDQFVWVVSFLFSSAFSFCSILYWKTNKQKNNIIGLFLKFAPVANEISAPFRNPETFHFQNQAVSASRKPQF